MNEPNSEPTVNREEQNELIFLALSHMTYTQTDCEVE